jgi:hypothetical protein
MKTALLLCLAGSILSSLIIALIVGGVGLSDIPLMAGAFFVLGSPAFLMVQAFARLRGDEGSGVVYLASGLAAVLFVCGLEGALVLLHSVGLNYGGGPPVIQIGFLVRFASAIVISGLAWGSLFVIRDKFQKNLYRQVEAF